MTSNYGTQAIGARIYIYREPDEIIGWLDAEHEQPARIVRGAGFGMIHAKGPTGRYVAHACCSGDVGTVGSHAEGLLMIARVTELHDASVLGPLF
jgi:hypothetical protein